MNEYTSTKKAINSAFTGLGIRHDLIGKRYLSLLRCSSVSQSDTSPDGQKEANDAYAAMQQMRWAGYDYYAEGVSGSQTFNRADIDEILTLKNTRNDFDVVVVFEYGRATRGGIRHGNVIEDAFKKAGIELISSTELIPDGPLGDLIKSVKHFSNQQQAFNISKSVARGLAQSLAKSSRPAAGRTPYGLDRLYVGPDGVERTLIRWDGPVQLRLDPTTGNEISRSVRQPTRKPRKKGQPPQQNKRVTRFTGYKKQDDERSMFVPGANLAHQTVVEIWRMYYVQNIGVHRIIRHLRQRGISSPSGGDWNMTSVHNILWNFIYLGVEVRHRFTKALYHQLGPDGPIAVNVDQDQLQQDGRISVPQKERPRDEWVLVDQPLLREFLPEEIRRAALPYIQKRYDKDAVTAKQAERSKKKNKHDDNPYVLSHLLHSKQTGHPMRGDTSARKLVGRRKSYRYYFDYSSASKALNGLVARRIPAEPIEEAVIPVVFKTLLDQDWVIDRVRQHIESIEDSTPDVDQQRTALENEKAEITQRLKRVHKTSQSLSDEDLEAIVSDDNLRLSAIRRELERLSQKQAQKPPTADEAVASVVERLMALPTDWKSWPSHLLKDFLKSVVSNLQIDLETLEVSMHVCVPTVRVDFTSAWPSSPDTNHGNALRIDKINCTCGSVTKRFACKRHKNVA
ncbi:MAG: recombinase family protein [Tepidisphaeraceae bacterium]